jgi:hypothetical protein
MRKFLLFTVLSAAGFSVAAQQQLPPPPKPDDAALKAEKTKEQESNAAWRDRTDGAAGGTSPSTERERQGVGAGAKPHMHFDPLDRGLRRRSEDPVVEPPK